MIKIYEFMEYKYQNIFLNLKEKFVINNLSKILPFFQNGFNLVSLIYIRRKFFKSLKKKFYLKIAKPKNILSEEKKIILYQFFFISFLNFCKKQYLDV